ncbi:hypothetical protein RUM44_009437 [Polyplax serrata]|uniref:Hexosyltransferase n=1 Tax=Polyplax serrata TaxID=468196 RepID=A0ABR1ASP5_POLSC
MCLLRTFVLWLRGNRKRFVRLILNLHLVLYTIFMCVIFYAWKTAGCPGFLDSYLCQPVSAATFITGRSDTPGDFTRLMNLRNFSFLINNFHCNNSQVTLLILIHSNTVNFEQRAMIRSTWGSVSDRYQLLFLLGTTNNEETVMLLKVENELYSDIIQGDFVDAYRNLTYKHVMGLKWANYFCPNAKYLLKTDDDVFINLPMLLKYLDGRSMNSTDKRLILCQPEENARACRSNRSKWKVKMSEYKFRSYPTFCPGYTILYSIDVVSTLYSLAQRSEYFWIDDVLITGILGLAAGFVPKSFGSLILSPSNMKRVNRGEIDIDKFLIGPPNIQQSDIRSLWWRTKVKNQRL